MTDRIDHAAEARTALAKAQMNPADADVITDPWLLAAQVHATLALVEQHRIANLIELSTPRRLPDGSQASYMLYDPETFKLRDDVRDGLGL
jgi:hypothetical protein